MHLTKRMSVPTTFRSVSGRRPSAQRNRARLAVERLEDRLAPAIITDMTALAQLFPRHSGPTDLYLNFDGWTAQGVSSFQSTTGNRTQDIHEILYRTSEMFAPFDVRVRRMYGNGAQASGNGATTIFLGDKSGNGTGTNNVAYAFTPWANADYPGDIHGIHHQPNSNAQDIAYVDPISWNGSMNVSWSNLSIARAVAHEAGHTFGLAHVLTSPTPEVMSYDATNTRFVNQTFNITDLNWTGTQLVNDSRLVPKWHHDVYLGWPFGTFHFPISLATQNSYTYLQAALGARVTSGDIANIADSTTVDASYVDGHQYPVGVGTSVTAYLQRSGDFDMFALNPTWSSWGVEIKVNAPSGSSVDPVLMVWNSSGTQLLAFNDDYSGLNSRLVFYPTWGESYKIVVGSYGANSTGAYTLSLNNYFPWVIYQPVLTTVYLAEGSGGTGSGFGGAGSHSLSQESVLLPQDVDGLFTQGEVETAHTHHGFRTDALYPHLQGNNTGPRQGNTALPSLLSSLPGRRTGPSRGGHDLGALFGTTL